MKRSFKNRLINREILLGTLVSLPSPDIAEVLSIAGFDWLFIDMEHGAQGMGTVQNILQAVHPDTACLVRVPTNEESWIKKCLDTGPAGLIIPHVNSARDAERAVSLSKYPPVGERSVGIGRAAGYGLNFEAYIDSANRESLLVLQIEHIDAVNNIESIVQVDGIDALFVGPYDLSASMGKMGQVQDHLVQEAIEKVRRCAQDSNLPLGIFGASFEAVDGPMKAGFSLLAVATDTLLLGNSAQKLVKQIRNERH